MHAFRPSYAWSLPVTRQRWQSIRHIRKPHTTRKLHGSVFYRTGVIADESLTLREWRFFYLCCSCDLDLDPLTFIHELDPYPLEI